MKIINLSFDLLFIYRQWRSEIYSWIIFCGYAGVYDEYHTLFNLFKEHVQKKKKIIIILISKIYQFYKKIVYIIKNIYLSKRKVRIYSSTSKWIRLDHLSIVEYYYIFYKYLINQSSIILTILVIRSNTSSNIW